MLKKSSKVIFSFNKKSMLLFEMRIFLILFESQKFGH